MKERGILFSAPMVRAILEGRKTQTRRTVKPAPGPPGPSHAFQHPDEGWWAFGDNSGRTYKCPYGVPGDRLWVRETWQPIWATEEAPAWGHLNGWAIGYPATDGIQEWHDEDKGTVTTCKPSIFMPRWASRITLEVTEVRVERLQDISEEDVQAEGCAGSPHGAAADRLLFPTLWGSINGEGSWDSNPWVWVISFKRIPQAPISLATSTAPQKGSAE